ncbi:hypothetical protein RFI_08567 [Reticulomyxa filosa]|uniref:Uncharacterized protein n=1 Tax=Reticulomyxa filosa TaxID=46433 RepID=X6NRJ7_RETFI|nr:hypothetical protein RFI_08567 [Reticulomyxa filosa]|eukprot:ETO28563.1 hypothetical protein RFI_08567 [Reticulomyxa filosa]
MCVFFLRKKVYGNSMNVTMKRREFEKHGMLFENVDIPEVEDTEGEEEIEHEEKEDNWLIKTIKENWWEYSNEIKIIKKKKSKTIGINMKKKNEEKIIDFIGHPLKNEWTVATTNKILRYDMDEKEWKRENILLCDLQKNITNIQYSHTGNILAVACNYSSSGILLWHLIATNINSDFDDGIIHCASAVHATVIPFVSKYTKMKFSPCDQFLCVWSIGNSRVKIFNVWNGNCLYSQWLREPIFEVDWCIGNKNDEINILSLHTSSLQLTSLCSHKIIQYPLSSSKLTAMACQNTKQQYLPSRFTPPPNLVSNRTNSSSMDPPDILVIESYRDLLFYSAKHKHYDKPWSHLADLAFSQTDFISNSTIEYTVRQLIWSDCTRRIAVTFNKRETFHNQSNNFIQSLGEFILLLSFDSKLGIYPLGFLRSPFGALPSRLIFKRYYDSGSVSPSPSERALLLIVLWDNASISLHHLCARSSPLPSF